MAIYYLVNKTLLEKMSKHELLTRFSTPKNKSQHTKAKLIKNILDYYSKDKQLVETAAWIGVCPYCRSEVLLVAPRRMFSNPKFCGSCGKTYPFYAFERNLRKTEQLVLLASKMNLKSEVISKNVLLEQGLVTVMTSFEVLLRDVYSIIYDHRHVIFGKSLYDEIYSSTRNEFLNLGSASKWIRKVSSINIKQELSLEKYKFLARMYSARHIIIHNCSTKDKDFLSQTGDSHKELNKPLNLKLAEVRKTISISRQLAKRLDQALRHSLFDYLSERDNIISVFKKQHSHRPTIIVSTKKYKT